MKFKYYIAKLMLKIQLPAIKNSKIHKQSKICSGSQIVDCTIDRYSFIAGSCGVICCEIGAFCSIANHCEIGGASHPINWVSTSPVFHQGKNILKKNFSNHMFNPYIKTYIGNDVWIGSNCHIKAGVKIGDGAIVGMGSIVTKDIPAYEIWAGNPAKKIRKRFDDNTIEKLLKIQWWKWDDEKIDMISKTIISPDDFISKAEEIKDENCTF